MLAVYVSRQQNYNLLDKHIERTDLKKVCGDTFSFEEFVKRSMQLYRQCSELVLERQAFKEDDESFIQWINQFNLIYTARITIVYENALDENVDFVKELLKNRIYNIVTGDEVKDIDEQFDICLSEKGMTIKNWINTFPELADVSEIKQAQQEQDFSKAKEVHIYVCGSQSRTGTTTTALGIARLLSSRGASVAYIEKNPKLISLLPEHFMCDTSNQEYINYKKIDFALSVPKKDYNFIINDCGVGPLRAHDGAKVLCGCFDIHEQKFTEKLYSEVKPDVLIGTFVSDSQQQGIVDKYSDAKVLFAEYAPEFLFDASKKNESIYLQVIFVSMEKVNQMQNDSEEDYEYQL